MPFFLHTLHCHWKERWILSETCEIFRKRKHQPEWQQHNSQLSFDNQQCAVCWWTHSEGLTCQMESPKQLTIITKCEHDNSATGILKCMFTVYSKTANIRTEVAKNNNDVEILAWYDIDGDDFLSWTVMGKKMNLLLWARNEMAFPALVSHYNAIKEVPRQLP